MKPNNIKNKIAWMLGGSVPRNRDELSRLLELTKQQSEIFPESEIQMLRNVLSLTTKRVEDVMIAHGLVDWLHADDTLSEIVAKVTKNNHSRYPVIDTNNERVTGILHVKKLVGMQAEPDQQILDSKILQRARTVPESKRLDSMLREFQYYHLHMMVVADEAGRPVGMVTIDDVLEHIVGEILDEFDSQNFQSTIRPASANGHWQMDGDTPLDKFNKQFNLDLDESRATTVGGWISNQLGRLPEAGETVKEANLLLRVTKTDQRRVIAIEITKQDEDDKQDSQANNK